MYVQPTIIPLFPDSELEASNKMDQPMHFIFNTKNITFTFLNVSSSGVHSDDCELSVFTGSVYKQYEKACTSHLQLISQACAHARVGYNTRILAHQNEGNLYCIDPCLRCAKQM